MNLKSIKKDSDAKLSGITIDIDRVDGSVRRVSLRDDKGGLVVIQGDYGVSVSVPEPPKMVKQWRIEGALKGLKFCELFEAKWDAETRLRELGAVDEEGNELQPVEVEIPEVA